MSTLPKQLEQIRQSRWGGSQVLRLPRYPICWMIRLHALGRMISSVAMRFRSTQSKLVEEFRGDFNSVRPEHHCKNPGLRQVAEAAAANSARQLSVCEEDGLIHEREQPQRATSSSELGTCISRGQEATEQCSFVANGVKRAGERAHTTPPSHPSRLR
jgi:hypothetical protein